MALENRAKGHGEWNTYTVVAIDGVIKLAVNGKFVNGIAQTSQKKGYLGLQSEGAEIHFRNITDHGAASRSDLPGADGARSALNDATPADHRCRANQLADPSLDIESGTEALDGLLELEPDVRLHRARVLPRVNARRILRSAASLCVWFSDAVGVVLVVDDRHRIARAGERHRGGAPGHDAPGSAR